MQKERVGVPYRAPAGLALMAVVAFGLMGSL